MNKLLQIVQYCAALLLLIILNFQSYAQAPVGKSKVITLKNGIILKGTVVSSTPGESLTFRKIDGEWIEIVYDDIKEIENYRIGGKSSKNSRGELVVLQDGSQLFGDISAYVPNDYLIITLRDGSSDTYFHEEIKKIKFDHKPVKNVLLQDRLMYHEIEMGFMRGTSSRFNGGIVNYTLHTIHGVRIKPWIQVGVGIGLDFQPNYRFIPFYLNVQGDIMKSRLTPIYYANLGYSSTDIRRSQQTFEYNSIRGGRFMSFGAGLKLKNNFTAWTFKVGYKTQDMSFSSDDFNDWFGRQTLITSAERQFRRLNITIGMQF